MLPILPTAVGTLQAEWGEGLTDVKGEGADIERVSVQEHDTNRTVW